MANIPYNVVKNLHLKDVMVCRRPSCVEPSRYRLQKEVEAVFPALPLTEFAAIVALHRDYVAIFRHRFGQIKVIPESALQDSWLGPNKQKGKKNHPALPH